MLLPAGKTKILDNIRRTNVQDGEAGAVGSWRGCIPCLRTSMQVPAVLERVKQA